MKKIRIIMSVAFFIGISSIAQATSEKDTNKDVIIKKEISSIILANSPGGCISEQCCHAQMQRCYNEGGNEICSDQYDQCVRNLRD